MIKMSKLLILSIALISGQVFGGGGLRGPLKVSIMSYNLENLFDTTHDEGKEDYTYLPYLYKQSTQSVLDYCNGLDNDYYRQTCLELDWSENVLNKKIQNLAKVITTYNNGQGADIIVFQEVENINALNLLVKDGLKGKGYHYVSLLEGRDIRGIDVGIISKYPIIKSKLHHIDISAYSDRETRSILEAVIKVSGKKISVFGNHWPSQGNVDECRIEASKVLKREALTSTSDAVIALGDFNTSHDDLLNGITVNIDPYFINVEEKAKKLKTNLNEGTHWYRGTWDSLDKIFVLKKSLKKISVDYSSFEIVKRDFMLTEKAWTNYETGETVIHQIPLRYDIETGIGFSDHLPIAVELNI